MEKSIHVKIRGRVFHEDEECFPRGGKTPQTFHFRPRKPSRKKIRVLEADPRILTCIEKSQKVF